MELALVMISYEARTHTIRACTGLSDDRIRRIYATYFKNDGHSGVRRQRGKSPARVSRLMRGPGRQGQATTLGLLCVSFGLVVIGPNLSATAAPASDPVEFGRRFCAVYHAYRALHPSPALSFERAWSLFNALTESGELSFVRCKSCESLYLIDVLGVPAHSCPCCQLKRAKQDEGVLIGGVQASQLATGLPLIAARHRRN